MVSFFIFEKYFKAVFRMNTYQEKISLLQEMISFALVDGELHDREYDFIEIVAQELAIEKSTLLELYANKVEINVVKDEFHRICQFYRLALLMQCDGVLHERENIKINEIGINMGLNPYAMKRVLKALEDSPKNVIDGQSLLAMFSEQLN